jgi:ribosomal protein L12E/L44/L45/RPP1/RPP2
MCSLKEMVSGSAMAAAVVAAGSARRRETNGATAATKATVKTGESSRARARGAFMGSYERIVLREAGAQSFMA